MALLSYSSGTSDVPLLVEMRKRAVEILGLADADAVEHA